jgi:uncharacterized protein (DUF1810 family)
VPGQCHHTGRVSSRHSATLVAEQRLDALRVSKREEVREAERVAVLSETSALERWEILGGRAGQPIEAVSDAVGRVFGAVLGPI